VMLGPILIEIGDGESRTLNPQCRMGSSCQLSKIATYDCRNFGLEHAVTTEFSKALVDG
jgi:hypothetical protein